MLRVDLRELAQGRAVPTQGELKQDDPALEGVDITLRDPVAVTGRLQSIGEGRFYWQGTARTVGPGERRPVWMCARFRSPLAAAQGPEGQAQLITRGRSNGRTQAQDLKAQEARAPHTLQGGASYAAGLPALR